MSDLHAALLAERRSAYARLRGGFPIPLAGTTYWALLAVIGYVLPAEIWYWAALFGSGLIFPLALMYAALFKNPFMKDRTAVTGVLVPAFISMLLFWPMAIAALWTAEHLFPLILAIGMSLHWPVIGWSYARLPVFAGHAIARAVIVFAIWHLGSPLDQITILPAAVAAIYLLTVIVVFIDSGRVKARLSRD